MLAMTSEFAQLSHARHRARGIRHRVLIVLGLTLIALGYFLMGVDPQTSSHWVLFRVTAGLGCIVLGFGMAVLPLLSRWTSGD